MDRYERISRNLFSCDLFYGKVDVKPSHNFICYYIVQQPVSSEFLYEQSLEMTLSHCRCINLYGKQSSLWYSAFKNQKKLVYQKERIEDIGEINEFDNLKDFVYTLKLDMRCHFFIPTDIILIYDDRKTYEKVLSLLKYQISDS